MKGKRRQNKLIPLRSLNCKAFLSFYLTSSHLFKELEKVKEEVGPKHSGGEVQTEQPESCEIFHDKKPLKGNLFQVPKKDEELPSTPVKAPGSSTPSAASASGRLGQYNSPIGLYSPETLREMMLMQGKLGEGSAASRRVSSLG